MGLWSAGGEGVCSPYALKMTVPAHIDEPPTTLADEPFADLTGQRRTTIASIIAAIVDCGLVQYAPRHARPPRWRLTLRRLSREDVAERMEGIGLWSVGR